MLTLVELTFVALRAAQAALFSGWKVTAGFLSWKTEIGDFFFFFDMARSEDTTVSSRSQRGHLNYGQEEKKDIPDTKKESWDLEF